MDCLEVREWTAVQAEGHRPEEEGHILEGEQLPMNALLRPVSVVKVGLKRIELSVSVQVEFEEKAPVCLLLPLSADSASPTALLD